MTRRSTNKLVIPYKEAERQFRSSRKLVRTRSLDYLCSPELNSSFNQGDLSEEEIIDEMGKPTMEEYMTKTRDDYGLGIVRPKIDDNAHFEHKGQFIKELCDNIFSGLENEDSNEHIEKSQS
ncbi:hypothetical protein Tco_0633378 [Tanacetum coccineum]